MSLSLGVLVALALLAEAGLRMAGYNPLGGALDGRGMLVRASDQPGLVYELTPGATGSWGGVEVSVNSAGFRDHEVDRWTGQSAPGTTRRVVVLGDSITMGWAFPLAATYPKVAEGRLAEQGTPVEFLNLGVAGYSTSDEVAFFEKVGRPLEPDLVVLGYCVNDIGLASQLIGHVKQLERQRWFLRHSRLLQWFAIHIGRASLRKAAEERARLTREEALKGEASGLTLPDGDPLFERIAELRSELDLSAERLRETGGRNSRKYLFDWYLDPGRLAGLRASFERLAALAEEDGFQVALLFVPYLDAGVEGTLVEPNRVRFTMVAEEARRVGFAVLDPAERFEEVGLVELRRGDDTVHPNPEGHAILADVLVAWVRDWLESLD